MSPTFPQPGERVRFDLAFSIGASCTCTEHLRRAGLQYLSFPGDWTGGPGFTERVDDVIDGFPRLLTSPDDLATDGDKADDGKHLSLVDRVTNYHYYHDFPVGKTVAESFPGVKDKYVRRTKRFEDLLEKSRHILIAWMGESRISHSVSEEEIAAAREKLSRRWPEKTFYFVVFVYNGGIPASGMIRSSGPDFERYEFDYLSREPGAPRWKFDDSLIQPVLRRFTVADYRTRDEKAAYRRMKLEKDFAKFGVSSRTGLFFSKTRYKLLRHFKRTPGGNAVKLASKALCTGCAACRAVCPKDAITMQPDDEGFLRPVVAAARCIGCGLCTGVCPVTSRRSPRQPLEIAAAVAKDRDLRIASSSGGAFTLLANRTLAAGGKVYGAVWNGEWKAVHRGTGDADGLAGMRGSKYLQSDVSDILREVKADLDAGREVLFSGTPCQIAGLRSFLGGDRPNLLSVELVCHGVPSPDVWVAFLRETAGDRFDRISDVSFRDKSIEGTVTALRTDFDDGTSSVKKTNTFNLAFLCELCNRPSCHRCAFRSLNSGADLTIGDFSGLSRMPHELDAEKGVSLIIACTPRGSLAFSEIKEEMDTQRLSYDDVLAWNPSLEHSFPPHYLRPLFMKKFRTEGVSALADRLLRVRGMKRRYLRLVSFFMRLGGST